MILWIVRDKNNKLIAFEEEPGFDGENYIGKQVEDIKLWYFPHITQENSPQEVEITISNEKDNV